MSDHGTGSVSGASRGGNWTVARVLISIVWLGFTFLVGLILVLWAWFTESEIAYGIGVHSPLTLPLMVLGIAGAWGAGPFVIWRVRRSRGWLVATIVVALLGLATALPKHAAERVQDEIRAFSVPPSWHLEFEEASGYGAPLFGERDSATRIFAAPNAEDQACAESRSALTAWARGATIQERPQPAGSIESCGYYVVRDGTFMDIAVYGRDGWDRHAAVMDFDMSRPSSAQSLIKVRTTDSSG